MEEGKEEEFFEEKAGDSKLADSDEEYEDVEPEFICLKEVRFNDGSDLCPVGDALDFEVDFIPARLLKGVSWEVKYLVDCVTKRNIIILGRSPKMEYSRERSTFHFRVDAVDVSHIKPSQLSNAGLLICTLKASDGSDLTEVKMVVQVSTQSNRNTGKPEHVRCIYNLG